MERPRIRWRAYVVAYLVWLILFTVVEGAGRQVCRMPTARWVAAGADARDRTARIWFRDRATECLAYTRWYSYSMAGLFAVSLLGPVGIVWLRRRPLTRLAKAQSFDSIRSAATLYGAVFVTGLAIMGATVMAVRWLYDWYA